jgi:hypothetical protein
MRLMCSDKNHPSQKPAKKLSGGLQWKLGVE